MATFTPVVRFFGGIFTGAWNLIVGVWERLSGVPVAYGAGMVGVFSVVAGVGWWSIQGAWNAIVSVFGGLAGWFRGIWNGVVDIFGVIVSIGNAIGGAFLRGAIREALC